MQKLANIRNVAIVAHVDHGKSTLADRLIALTGAVPEHKQRAQQLDTMDIERERGITIKLQPIRMKYSQGGEEYIINLIDTPGHVDFSYEVSRTLAAVEGVILLVDASQGMQAQTLAHAETAIAAGLTVIPVLNKIDLPNADPERVTGELTALLGVSADEVLQVSAKEGTGVEALLKAIVDQTPAPKGKVDGPTRALVFDSLFDAYRGVIAYVRVVDGSIKARDSIELMASGAESEIAGVGTFAPQRTPSQEISAGLTGYIETNLKSIRDVRVGDTITHPGENAKSLPGYAPSEPKVFAALFPEDPDEFHKLKEALERLELNDAALTYEPAHSAALGAGFRVGFLGLLHLEIIQERVMREFNIEIVSTAPSVPYRLPDSNDTVQNPAELPAGSHELLEPWTAIEVVTPTEYIGGVLQLISASRGQLKGQEYLDPTRVVIRADVPLSEVIVGFYDKLKSFSKGFASLHYELADYRLGSFSKLDIMLSGQLAEALTTVVPSSRAQRVARNMVKQLKELVPQQQFAVPVQALVGGKIIARETVSARRKDVTAKLYGGDVTRKRKLLEKQKKGKKKLAASGRVTLPPSAYLKLLRGSLDDR